jgi:pyruvate dehydrogenase E2 component (dihydrolipoamide acetyltransferase)
MWATNGTAKSTSNIRGTIAARMLASAQTTAAVTLTTHLDASHLVALRKQFRAASTEGEIIPSFTDILVKLTAAALKQHPEANSVMDERGSIISNDEEHIGIAVDTPSGLLVPVLRSVGRLTLRQVAVRTRELIDRTRQRTLSAFELQGGTFTVTNLGMYCVDSFTPLLNPPQAAILGVGRITREPTVVEDQIVIRDRLTLSLTFDHRILDGAPAARFLDTLVKLIANPAPALIG